VRQTSTGYGLPLVGSDCFVYVTEESYTHPDASTFNTVSYALLRVNPQTGQRTKVIDLDQAGNFYLVGQDPVTREIYLADTITLESECPLLARLRRNRVDEPGGVSRHPSRGNTRHAAHLLRTLRWDQLNPPATL
jgi:hypothetical protein